MQNVLREHSFCGIVAIRSANNEASDVRFYEECGVDSVLSKTSTVKEVEEDIHALISLLNRRNMATNNEAQ